MKARTDLKIVIMSATLDAGKFQKYFDKAPLMVSNLVPVHCLGQRCCRGDHLLASIMRAYGTTKSRTF